METKIKLLIIVGSILFGIGLSGAVVYFTWIHTIKIAIGANITNKYCNTEFIQCRKCPDYELGKTVEYYIDCLKKRSSFDSSVIFADYLIIITCAFPGAALLFISIVILARRR